MGLIGFGKGDGFAPEGVGCVDGETRARGFGHGSHRVEDKGPVALSTRYKSDLLGVSANKKRPLGFVRKREGQRGLKG